MMFEYLFLTVEEISVPRYGTVHVYKDYWWPTTEDGRVCVAWNPKRSRGEYAQCNKDQRIAAGVKSHDLLIGPAIQIPLAFSNLDTRDYC